MGGQAVQRGALCHNQPMRAALLHDAGAAGGQSPRRIVIAQPGAEQPRLLKAGGEDGQAGQGAAQEVPLGCRDPLGRVGDDRTALGPRPGCSSARRRASV